jgi:hypothetical protein
MRRFIHVLRIGFLGLGVMISAAAAEQWAVDNGSAYTKGSKLLQFGVAALPFGFIAAYDYGFHEAISGGAAMGVMIAPLAYVPIVVRAGFHPFNLKAWSDRISIRDKLDVYAGLSSGFQLGTDAPDVFVFREYIGAKYYFDSKLGIFADDCGGFFAIGLIIKL